MNDLKSSLQGIAPKATSSKDDGKLISDVNLLLTGACSAALLGKKEMQLMRCRDSLVFSVSYGVNSLIGMTWRKSSMCVDPPYLRTVYYNIRFTFVDILQA